MTGRPRSVQLIRPTPLAVLLVLAAASAGCGTVERLFTRSRLPPEDQRGVSVEALPPGGIETIAEGLEIPWEIVFLPDGSLLVSERPGRLLHLPGWSEGDPPLRPADGVGWQVAGVRHTGEGGLMGMALHPDFPENGWLYLMMTGEGEDGLENRIERYRFTPEGLTDRTVILDGIPGSRFHNGGRIVFGPDGRLYATTGDAEEPSLAQDVVSLAGKVLRLGDRGEVPPDNPFGSPVWSYGHRNAQGLAWDGEARLWSTEHGRSGIRSGLDELNRIVPGGNHGWPLIEGDESRAGLLEPVLHSGPSYTWAPAGLARVGERLYFGGLRGEALYEATLAGEEIAGFVAHFATEIGRIRAVVPGPDGMLYLATSNRDGRGRVRQGDDRIVRVDPAALR